MFFTISAQRVMWEGGLEGRGLALCHSVSPKEAWSSASPAEQVERK